MARRQRQAAALETQRRGQKSPSSERDPAPSSHASSGPMPSRTSSMDLESLTAMLGQATMDPPRQPRAFEPDTRLSPRRTTPSRTGDGTARGAMVKRVIIDLTGDSSPAQHPSAGARPPVPSHRRERCSLANAAATRIPRSDRVRVCTRQMARDGEGQVLDRATDHLLARLERGGIPARTRNNGESP